MLTVGNHHLLSGAKDVVLNEVYINGNKVRK